ncbi:MAG: response regulator transcription factor [Chloroflexota bacterium]
MKASCIRCGGPARTADALDIPSSTGRPITLHTGCISPLAAELIDRLTSKAELRSAFLTERRDQLLRTLSEMDRDILQGLVAGLTNAQIGERLGFSLPAVGRHVSRLFQLLGVERRTEAAVVCVVLGLFDEDQLRLLLDRLDYHQE